jgi:hypothetical protein
VKTKFPGTHVENGENVHAQFKGTHDKWCLCTHNFQRHKKGASLCTNNFQGHTQNGVSLRTQNFQRARKMVSLWTLNFQGHTQKWHSCARTISSHAQNAVSVHAIFAWTHAKWCLPVIPPIFTHTFPVRMRNDPSLCTQNFQGHTQNGTIL